MIFMTKCPNCHGAGFTLHQVDWSMDRVRILCKTCDGIGYTYRKVMTPTQRRQLANILLKEGEEGWRVEVTPNMEGREFWELMKPDHYIRAIGFKYRAVRIERTPTRTPLPIEHYRRGMEVATDRLEYVVLGHESYTALTVHSRSESINILRCERIEKWRWPNETEWKPAFTETVEEKIVETLIVEGL